MPSALESGSGRADDLLLELLQLLLQLHVARQLAQAEQLLLVHDRFRCAATARGVRGRRF